MPLNVDKIKLELTPLISETGGIIIISTPAYTFVK